MYYPRTVRAELARRWKWQSKAKNVTISQLMRALGRAVHDLQHSRSGLVSDKALSFASCFISHSITPLVL